MENENRSECQAREELERIGLPRKNPYLCAIADGTLPFERLQCSQAQFFFAVEHFARPMAVLVGRIPDPAIRLELLRNVVEEHGDFNQDHFHVNSFRRFLRSIALDPEMLAAIGPHPSVVAFNETLSGVCWSGEPATAAACLGTIELAFADISALIGSSLVQHGWVKAENLHHYKLHAELDHKHARDFFVLAEALAGANSPKILAGIQLGAFVFDRLYRDLLAYACESTTVAPLRRAS